MYAALLMNVCYSRYDLFEESHDDGWFMMVHIFEQPLIERVLTQLKIITNFDFV